MWKINASQRKTRVSQPTLDSPIANISKVSKTTYSIFIYYARRCRHSIITRLSQTAAEDETAALEMEVLRRTGREMKRARRTRRSMYKAQLEKARENVMVGLQPGD